MMSRSWTLAAPPTSQRVRRKAAWLPLKHAARCRYEAWAKNRGFSFHACVLETPGTWGSGWKELFEKFKNFFYHLPNRETLGGVGLDCDDRNPLLQGFREELSCLLQQGNAEVVFRMLQEIRATSVGDGDLQMDDLD